MSNRRSPGANRKPNLISRLGDLDPDRDPRIDPRPGDRVGSPCYGEVAEAIEAPMKHGDPNLGPEPGVYARVDSSSGRRGSVMSLETWRVHFKNGLVIDKATAQM